MAGALKNPGKVKTRGKTFISWWTLVFEEVVIILDRWSVLMVKPSSWLVQTRSISKGQLEGWIEYSRLGWREYKKHSHRTVGAGGGRSDIKNSVQYSNFVFLLGNYWSSAGGCWRPSLGTRPRWSGDVGWTVGAAGSLWLLISGTGLGNVQQCTLWDRTQTVQCNIWGNSVEAPSVQLPCARDGCHQAWYPPAVTSSLISGRQCNIWCPAYCTHFQLHITARVQCAVY